MMKNNFNTSSGVYKVKTFGTIHHRKVTKNIKYDYMPRNLGLVCT